MMDSAMEPYIEQAVVLLGDLCVEDGDVRKALINAGVEEALGSRLVEFVPMAFGRALLEASGAQFPETYQRYGRDGKISPARALGSQPVWRAAAEYARRALERGLSVDEMLVAKRSAEYRVADELLSDGSRLEDLRLTVPLFGWPDEADDEPLPPAKPWWNFWR
jgi:hypothetical protein